MAASIAFAKTMFLPGQFVSVMRQLSSLHTVKRHGVMCLSRTRPSGFHNRCYSTEAQPSDSQLTTTSHELSLPEESVSGDLSNLQERKIISPLEHDDFFGVEKMFSLKDLFDRRVHLGHKKGVREPNMVPYLFGTRLDIDIIDIEQTFEMLRSALNFVGHIAYREGLILFVSRNRQMMPFIEKTANEVGEYAHCRYWRGGILTNSSAQFGTTTRLPDLMIFLNTLNNSFEQHKGIIDAAKMSIPTVGIVDSNCDPNLITYPIPGNDDTPVTVNFYLSLFKEVIMKAKAMREKMKK